MTVDPVVHVIVSDDENSMGTFACYDCDCSSGFPEDVLLHLSEEPERFATEEPLFSDEDLEWLAIEFDPRVAGTELEAESIDGAIKRKADSLVEDLEVAPESKRTKCRTASSHAETIGTKVDQFARIGQATTSWIKRK